MLSEPSLCTKAQRGKDTPTTPSKTRQRGLNRSQSPIFKAFGQNFRDSDSRVVYRAIPTLAHKPRPWERGPAATLLPFPCQVHSDLTDPVFTGRQKTRGSVVRCSPLPTNPTELKSWFLPVSMALTKALALSEPQCPLVENVG